MNPETLKERQSGIKVGDTIKTLVTVRGVFMSGKIVSEKSASEWMIDFGDGSPVAFPKNKVINSCVSTNSVVANAMAVAHHS